MSHPFTLSQGASLLSNHLPQQLLLLLHLSIHPGTSGNTPPQTQWMTCLLTGPHPRQPWKGPLAPNGKIFHPFTGCYHRAPQILVRETREEYFKRHFPNFTMEGTHDLSEVFRHMAETTKLLGLAIYKIKEVWKGLDEL